MTALQKLTRCCLAVLLLAPSLAVAADRPNLLFKDDLPTLKTRAATAEGKKIVARLDELLSHDQKGFKYNPGDAAFPYCEGWWASGHAFRYLLSADKADLDRAKEQVATAMELKAAEWGGWGNAQMIAGTAVAYNLVGDQWDADFRAKVHAFLVAQANRPARSGKQAADCYNQMIFRSAAGLAALALVAENPKDEVARKVADGIKNELLTFAKIGLGDTGWRNGQWCGFADTMDVALPFILAYRNVLGADALGPTPLDGLPSVYIMNGGRFHGEMGPCWGSLILPLTPEKQRPAVKWFIDQYNADPNAKEGRDPPKFVYHIRWPHHAILALAYAAEVKAQSPDKLMPKTLVDNGIGGYALRAGWEVPNNAWVTYHLETRGVTPPVCAGTFQLKALGTNAYDPITWIEGARVSGIGEWHANTCRFDTRTSAAPAVVRILDGDAEIFPARGPTITYSETQLDGSASITATFDHFVRGTVRSYYFLLGTPHKTDGVELPITHTRAFAVDFSGKSGAPCVVIVVDKLTGTDKYTTFAQFNLGRGGKAFPELKTSKKGEDWPYPAREGVEKRILGNGALSLEKGAPPVLALPDGPLLVSAPSKDKSAVAPTMRVVNITGNSLSLAPSGRLDAPPGGVLLTSGGNEFFTIFTVAPGKQPEVKIAGQGLDARVTIGGQTITFDGKRIVLGK